MRIIELENIQRIFQVGDEMVYALRKVSLRITSGDYISIMGPSGSGKSTLLNILGLLDRPNEGVYQFEDRNITALSELEQAWVRRHKIGFVFQFFHLIPRLTAAENVEMPLILSGEDRRKRRKKVNEMLARIGLADRAKHRPDQLSGGQRQRVAIARATIMNPAVILADEPTGNLDRASGNDVVQTIEALNDNGMTVLMVTHDPELGDRARRRIQMVDGQIASDEGDQA